MLKTYAAHFKVDPIAIFRAFKSLKITRKKKTLRYKERDETKRLIFLKKIEGIPSEHIVYIDENGIDKCLHQPFGWAPRGKKVYGEISGKHFARENFIAGICNKEIIAPFCYQGTCNAQLFNL